MKIIYHSSVQGIFAQVASAIHLGILPRERLPIQLEWNRIPFLNGFTKEEMGGVFLVGKTKVQNEVYILAYPPALAFLVRKTAASAWQLLKTTPGEMVMVDCGNVIKMNRFKLDPPDSHFVQSYFAMVHLVEQVEGGSYT